MDLVCRRSRVSLTCWNLHFVFDHGHDHRPVRASRVEGMRIAGFTGSVAVASTFILTALDRSTLLW
jgi:hypothetical protein